MEDKMEMTYLSCMWFSTGAKVPLAIIARPMARHPTSGCQEKLGGTQLKEIR